MQKNPEKAKLLKNECFILHIVNKKKQNIKKIK